MIEESATVVQVEGDRIVVEAQVKSTCSSCNAQKNCGTGAVARAFSHRSQQLELSSPMPVVVGDSVIIGIAEQSVLVASWWLYLMPILVFFSALMALNMSIGLQVHELLIFGGALVPTYASFVWVSNKLKRLDKGRFQPVILRRLTS
jgi:sigma-E factor negative regulatory protein RseC